MSEQTVFNSIIIGWLLLTVAVFLTLIFVAAPYGRHSRYGWGPSINNKLGWIIMEAPAPLVFLLLFIIGSNAVTLTTIVFLILWQMHYVHRAFIYPFSLRSKTGGMPIIIIAFGFIFNTVNGYLNGRYLFTISGGYGNDWLGDPRFFVGVLLFISGFIINRQADQILHDISASESGYSIPYGGLYRWISSPNYFGEITIWSGWALATWSLPALAFAVWTAANLVPRARSHQAWYQENFPEYPSERKALLPKLW